MISKVAPVTLKTPVHKLKELSSIPHPSEISDVRQLNVNATIEVTYPDQSQLTVKLFSCTGKVGKSKLGKYQNEWNVCKADGVIFTLLLDGDISFWTYITFDTLVSRSGESISDCLFQLRQIMILQEPRQQS